MGQCRSKISELLPSPSHHKAHRKGTAALEDSYSELGGRGLLSDGSVNESFRSNQPPSSQKRQFDYYGGTIDDLIIEETDETKASQ